MGSSPGATGSILQPALTICWASRDALILARDAIFQATDLSVHPQKHLHNHLTTSVIDRLRLNPIHTTKFDTTELSPPTN